MNSLRVKLPWQVRPFSLISWRSIMNIRADHLVNLGSGLQMLADVLSGTQPPPSQKWMKDYFEGVKRDLEFFGFSDLADSARRLGKDVGNVKNHAIGIRANELRILIEARLESHLFLWISPIRAEAYRQNDPYFGEAVAKKFPSAALNIEESGKCLACRRTTAAVVHCMRVLEHGLRAFCAAVNVPFGERTWKRTLEAIEKKLAVLDSQVNPKRKQAWLKRRQFYNEAITEFRHFKDAWRNYAAHGRSHYDEPRAEIIISHTRSFMQVLATKLKEVKSQP
jgi:hypothetical protein